MRFLGLIGLGLAAIACTPGGVNLPAPATPIPPDAAVTATPTAAPTATPTPAGSPGIGGNASPEATATPDPGASPTPKPSATPKPPATPKPSPSPTVTRFESEAFFLSRPLKWTVEINNQGETKVLLRATTSAASFSVLTDLSVSTLENWKAAAQKRAGTNKIAEGAHTLDGVKGYTISSNQDLAEGRRFVAEYGYAYATRIYAIRTVWDKKGADADAIAAATAAILKSYRWI